MGTCRQCGSWSVADHNHTKVIGREWARPHLCQLARHGLWPVRKRFIRDNVWRWRSKPERIILNSYCTRAAWSAIYETILTVRLETSGGVLSTVDMVVQRRHGPRWLRDRDDKCRRVVRGSILCDPIQPNPSADWPNPTQPTTSGKIWTQSDPTQYS